MQSLSQLLTATALLMALPICSAALGQSSSSSSEKLGTPKVGDEAPDWTLTGSDDKQYKLSDFKGKQAVVVAWYPVALTGG